MRFALIVLLAAGVARADTLASRGTQDSKLRLLPVSYHGAAPVPSPAAPMRAAASGSLVMLGLGLTGAGLVLGGAGFAVLYLCREGTTCNSPTTTTVGWVLAAPGILPLIVGIAILYFGSGSSRSSQLVPEEKVGQWAFSVAPLSGGGWLGARLRF